ncbi:MAG: carbonate dehydratase [Gemmatimonadetes bacterium]|nr:carbonate dehydratase [Gemmatimonadota bacterium]
MTHHWDLLAKNKAWAARMVAQDPEFFSRLRHQQAPRWLWVGCSDSRVPANEIVDLEPGELFVHRNVANVVVHTDLNCLSVLQYAVEVLRVEHVIVCGHYGCGGVRAAWERRQLGLIDNWLRHVQDVADKHADHLGQIAGGTRQEDRLCELNALEQALHVCRTTVVQDAWRQHLPVTVHGWIYSLEDGLIRETGFRASSPGDVERSYTESLGRTRTRLS